MVRNSAIFPLSDTGKFIKEALIWSQGYDHFTYYTPNQISYPFQPFKHFMGVGALDLISPRENAFDQVFKFHQEKKDWLLGYFGYDLKNQTEDLSSNNIDHIGAPDCYFYQPQHMLFFHPGKVEIHSTDNPELILKKIQDCQSKSLPDLSSPELKMNIMEMEYYHCLDDIKNHIVNGDIYEMNFCLEFFKKEILIDPLETFSRLNSISPMPFAAFHLIDGIYLMSSSPERFLKKEGQKLISQPIKGTIKRSSDPIKDKELKEELRNNEKERAENMMIVDLVRNDLARSAIPGSVKVDEIFGVYSFEFVHQMISTVTASLPQDFPFTQAIKNAFPMGSMTGAPKIKVMELIERYERTRRGLFSGAVGYITPEADFDFNVVIRSIIYNSKNRNLSCQVGSAITYDSIAEREFQECLLKVKPVLKSLEQV